MFLVAAVVPGDRAAPLQPTTPHIAALLDAYAAGDADRALAATRAFGDAGRLRDAFQSEAPAWVDGGGGDPARRRLVAAAFALEIVHSRLDPEWQSLKGLIEWNCERLRKSPAPLAAERQWHLAAIALALRAADVQLLAPASQSGHLGHAAARFPSEPRIPLAEGIALESRMPVRRARNSSAAGAFVPLPPPPDGRPGMWGTTATMLVRRYAELSSVATVQAEARMRRGWRLLAGGEPKAALVSLDAARTAPDDPFVRYLADLFRAWALEALDRAAEAEAAYRAALSTLPGAQSASLGLSALLFLKGDVDGAYAVMTTSFSAQGTHEDPWRIYALGDYRMWPSLIEQLRAAVRP
jgi:hypothetical protein